MALKQIFLATQKTPKNFALQNVKILGDAQFFVCLFAVQISVASFDT